MTRDGCYVQVNGRGFDTDPGQVGWQTIPVTRDSVDQGAGAGESSLSNGTIWRRDREDFVEGAGQHYGDLLGNESSRLRFWSSYGINPWTRRELTLQRATTHSLTSANTNLGLAVATQAGADYVFVLDGTTVRKASNPGAGSWSALTGGGGTYTSITTDGARIWVCNGTDVYAVASGGALSSFSTVDCDLVGYASGRLLAAKTNALFELDSAGVRVDIFTHPSTAFVWDGIVPSPGGIYCFGHLGMKTEIYNVTVIDATGALDVPIHAGDLPDGETLNTMAFYLGVMVLGTTRGLRLGIITGGGFLSTGPVIEQPGSVRCLEPQGEDVWFGWPSIPTAGSGLGRARLSRFTSELVPAFASDLAAAGTTAAVTSVATFGNLRVFSVAGSGVWIESTTNYVAAGEIDFGFFSYGVPEEKLIDSVGLWCNALPAGTTINVKVYADDDTVTPLINQTMSATGAAKAAYKATTQTPAERYRVVIRLASGSVTTTPTFRRFTMRITPQPFVAEQITAPLLLADKVSGEGSGSYDLDVYAEWLALHVLLVSRARFPLRVGSFTADARLEALEVAPGGLGGDNGLTGWDRNKHFLAGKWNATFVTLEPSSG